MVQITYRKKGISITQIWFAAEAEKVKTDICFYHGVLKDESEKGFPVKKTDKNSFYTEFHTLLSDLSQEEETQIGLINKNVRYEIRRNCKEPVEYKVFMPEDLKQNPDVIQKFGDIYESMYKSKGQNATFNRQQFESYLEKDAILLTAIYQEDIPIVFHSYIVGENQVRLLHSVSEFRNGELDANLVARANKRLHWDDMCLFKKQGKEIYDWGGVSSIENPNGIDAFKFKFGGEPFTYFNVYEGKTLLGKLAIWFMKIKNGKK